MSLEERIWALDKDEVSLLRSYFTGITTCHEERDVIVAKKWSDIKKNQGLTHSIVRRMITYYKYIKEYSERMERPLGREAGTYFEDIIFSPLKALLDEKCGGRIKISRNKKIEDIGKPDIIIEDSKTGKVLCLIEIKAWLNRTDWTNMQSTLKFCQNRGCLFICITGSVGGEELKKEMRNVFWLTEEGFYELKNEYEATIVHPVEDVFEKIIQKCQCQQ